ncbi:FG-GAP repeat domain-containing protein [Lysobacter fragariae]
MNRLIPLSMITLALGGITGLAQAREPARHNDLDGDGRSDLIWRNAATGTIVYWSHASAAVARYVQVDHLASSVPSGFDLRRMSPALTIGEGIFYSPRGTLLVRDAGTGFDFDLFPHNGSTGYSAYKSLGTSDWKAVGAGDFDGNGTSDVLYRNQRDGRNFLHAEAAWADWSGVYPVASVSNLAWTVAGIGDFDGDARSDVLWRNATTGQNAIWRSGNAATRLGIASVRDLDWKVATVGDFDGDGRSDILWRNTRTGANAIWKSGNNLLRQVVANVIDQRWQVTATGDFNGDGKWDLFWRNSATGANVIWNSANSATRQTLPLVAVAWATMM